MGFVAPAHICVKSNGYKNAPLSSCTCTCDPFQACFIDFIYRGELCVSGTCWNTQQVWGHGWLKIPQTSLLFIVKGGKVMPTIHTSFTLACCVSNENHWLFVIEWRWLHSPPGRTGTMVCTWLIDSDQFESAQVWFIKDWEFSVKYANTDRFLTLVCVCPPGQSGLLWWKEDWHEPKF